MKEFTIGEITEAVEGKLLHGSKESRVRGFAIDSREIQENQMFFCIPGARSDGHDFIDQVLQKGIKAVAVSDESKVPCRLPDGTNVILVSDTTQALLKLAKYYLKMLPLKKKIGVTGSVGKTSTRDFVYYVSSVGYKTGRNKRNFNSAVGLPLSVLEFDEDTEIAVLEMGMDTFGEIEELADVVRPDIAIITRIAEVNIESMKNLDNILKAKMEITTFFDENSTLIVNSSCPMLSPERVKGQYNLVTVGDSGKENYIVSDICDFGDKGIKYNLSRNDKKWEIALPTAGAHNAFNASLALAAGELIGISPEEGKKGLMEASLTGKRLKVAQGSGVKVIDDTYNACGDSVKSALDTLAAAEGKRKVAILGDILGLADRSEAVHMDAGRHAADCGVDLLIAVGNEARFYAMGARESMNHGKVKVMYFGEKKEFIEKKDEIIKKGDVILVKASRGMEMEEIVNNILEG